MAVGRFPFSDSPDSEELSPSVSDFDPDPTLPRSVRRPKIESNSGRNGVSQSGGPHAMSILDLLQHIVNEPAPRLASRRRTFPQEAVAFVEGCLIKDPDQRRSPKELLVSDNSTGTTNFFPYRAFLQSSPWMTNLKPTKEDLQAWAQSMTGPREE